VHPVRQGSGATTNKILSELVEARSAAAVAEFNCVQRLKGVSFLRPEAASLADFERAKARGVPSTSAMRPSSPSESDVDEILRLPAVGMAQSKTPRSRKPSKYEASSPPLTAPTPPTSVHSPDELTIATSAASLLSTSGTQIETSVSAVERIRRLTSALNSRSNDDYGERSLSHHQTQCLDSEGHLLKTFSVMPAKQPLLMSLGSHAIVSMKDEVHPATAARRASIAAAKKGRKAKGEREPPGVETVPGNIRTAGRVGSTESVSKGW